MSSKKLPSNQERVIQNKDVQHLNKTGCDYIFLVTVKDTFYPMDHCVSVCMSVCFGREVWGRKRRKRRPDPFLQGSNQVGNGLREARWGVLVLAPVQRQLLSQRHFYLFFIERDIDTFKQVIVQNNKLQKCSC